MPTQSRPDHAAAALDLLDTAAENDRQAADVAHYVSLAAVHASLAIVNEIAALRVAVEDLTAGLNEPDGTIGALLGRLAERLP